MSEQSSNSIHNEQPQQLQPQQLNDIIHVNEPRKETEQQSTFISYLVQYNVKLK